MLHAHGLLFSLLGPPCNCRQLHAMAVAQWEVVRAVLARCNNAAGDIELAKAATRSLASALELGPAALASSAELQDASIGALHQLHQVGCMRRLGWGR